jgi:hypothetical protein
MQTSDIKPLGPKEDPSLALFFLLDEKRATGTAPWEEGDLANGLAFVVHASGILATAAHVAWMDDRFPGDRVYVRCVASSAPFSGIATILEDGWRGPGREVSGMARRLAKDLLDERPDVVREDVAFLRLEYDTFEFDDRGGNAPASPTTMVEQLRVLPLGAPGYRTLARTALEAWCVDRHFQAPRLLTAAGTFDLHETGLFSAFQIDAPLVTFGYSGSPVWDPARRLAVGFVRSETSRHQPGKTRCTDVRAIHAAGGIELVWDSQLQSMAEACKALAGSYFKRRHDAGIGGAEHFVEPAARVARLSGDLGLTDTGEDAHPALGFIEEAIAAGPITCLMGAPGAGKSTVLRTLAVRLAGQPFSASGRACIPLFVNAADLREKFTIDEAYLCAAGNPDGVSADSTAFSIALQRNDADVILLVDGLDEAEPRTRMQLLANFQALLAGPNRVARIVLTSRFIHEAMVQPAFHRYRVTHLELMAFDANRISQFALGSIGKEKGALFLAALGNVNWQDTASPLQLQMALGLFAVDLALPRRESDLLFDYLGARVQHALAEEAKAPSPGCAGFAGALSLAGSMQVLQALALACYQGDMLHDTAAAVLERFTPVFSRMEPGARVIDAAAVHAWIRDVLAPKVGLVAIGAGARGERYQWEHATLIEVLAAQAKLALAGGDTEQVAALVGPLALATDDRFILSQICVLDRAGWHQVVAKRIEQALESPVTQKKEGMFALRALAAGVELPQMLRRRLVVLLIRLALSPKAEQMTCAEVFLPNLPKARDILRRLDLRDDVLAALWQRFHPRNPKRRGKMEPLVVMRGEAIVLDLLDLWNHWIHQGLELARPGEAGDRRTLGPRPVRMPVRPAGPTDLVPTTLERGGFQVMHRDSTFTQVEMPAEAFLEGIVAMARALPPHLPPSQVVDLYLKGMAEVVESDSWRLR